MTDQPPPDDEAARRVDRPDSAPDELPYDEEMTEPDEANAPDAARRDSPGDEELGRPK
jgi:hypothetical protein